MQASTRELTMGRFYFWLAGWMDQFSDSIAACHLFHPFFRRLAFCDAQHF